MRLAETGVFSAIVLDHRLAGICGVEICRQIRGYDQKTPIVFYTASGFPQERQEGLEAGANEYLVKPDDFDRIVETIKRLVT